MKAVTTIFEQPNRPFYQDLLNVFVSSWQEHNSIPLEVHQLPILDVPRSEHHSFLPNHIKLHDWVETILKTDEDIILIDCDMLAVGNSLPAFNYTTHIGICKKPEGAKYPFNGGFITVKNTQPAKEFMKAWLEADKLLYANPILHKTYNLKYAGMNQSSFGYLLEQTYWDEYISWIPNKFNVCEPWVETEDAVNIHIKGALRTAVQKQYCRPGPMRPIYRKWNSYKEKL